MPSSIAPFHHHCPSASPVLGCPAPGFGHSPARRIMKGDRCVYIYIYVFILFWSAVKRGLWCELCMPGCRQPHQQHQKMPPPPPPPPTTTTTTTMRSHPPPPTITPTCYHTYPPPQRSTQPPPSSKQAPLSLPACLFLLSPFPGPWVSPCKPLNLESRLELLHF